MAAVAREVLPEMEMRGTKALRGPSDAIALMSIGAAMWLLIAIGFATLSGIMTSRLNFTVIVLAVSLPAAGVIDLYLMRKWGRRAVLRIGPEGLGDEDHEKPIAWRRITLVTRKKRLIDVDAGGDEENDWDGALIFPHAFERWHEAEAALRFYLARNSISNNLDELKQV